MHEFTQRGKKRPFAAAATADAANVGTCSAGHFAVQHFSPNRPFKRADLGCSQNGLSQRPFLTNEMRTNLPYAVLVFVWLSALFSAKALKGATSVATVSAHVPKAVFDN
ncbi:MAG: hypothetical protein WAO78_10595 [Roseovarius sp.]